MSKTTRQSKTIIHNTTLPGQDTAWAVAKKNRLRENDYVHLNVRGEWEKWRVARSGLKGRDRMVST